MHGDPIDGGAPPAHARGDRIRDSEDDPLQAIPFEEIVRRRLRPVVATLEDGAADGSVYREVVEQVERVLVGLALERTGGNQQRAARLLGISRNTLRAKRGEETPPGPGGNGRRPQGNGRARGRGSDAGRRGGRT